MSENNFYMRYSNTFYDTLAEKMKKQNYLRDNILNQGYNREEFTQYMIDERDHGTDIDNWTYEELVEMVKAFKRKHTSNAVGAEMFDDGNEPSNSDEEVKYEEREFEPSQEELEYPSLDSPRLTNDIRKDRTMRINKKDDYDAEEDLSPDKEDSPEVPNESSPVQFDRKRSSVSQGEYEVIGDNNVRESITPKNKGLEELKDSTGMRGFRSKTTIDKKYSKTDKGFSEISQLKKKNLSVLVGKGRVIKEGFFSFSYVSYEIQLNPIGWIVRRKEQDFVFLREYLKKKYPQHFVPPLVLTNDRMSEVGIKKKEKYFTRFLINVLRNQDLRGSYFLQEFLNTDSQEAFEKLTEQRRQEEKPENLKEYTTVHGKANVKSQTKTWQFCSEIPTFAKKYETLNHKISQCSKVLVDQFKALTGTMEELASYFDELGNLYTETDENMFEINKSISALLSSWGDSYQGQSDILKNWFPRFFKYNMNEHKSMTEIFEHRNLNKERFGKMQVELESMKNKLYIDRDFDNWGLSKEDMDNIDELDQDEYLAKSRMLPEETSKLNDQKLLLNYLNNTLENEIRRVLRYNFKDLKGHFLRIADQMCQILTNTQIVWGDFIAHYVDEKEASSDEEYISCFDTVKRTRLSST